MQAWELTHKVFMCLQHMARYEGVHCRLSPLSTVATLNCHHSQLSPLSTVTTLNCHHSQLSPLSTVATLNCRHQALSYSRQGLRKATHTLARTCRHNKPADVRQEVGDPPRGHGSSKEPRAKACSQDVDLNVLCKN